ncbi:sigma-70 family RNA polymerase sigma factor [Lysinibacillus agricola]|uniref:Sigma-70 family RNA polymerase sigma factor n=1 Tax=Lysinibacillus agricola TaxID=2590012 RepID=A0ABX7ATP6_9BACI|nr:MULTISPECIES: sigma-70 family RNA polymerase sigma factor [Lysinibacillus]KOS60640.1 RNA polymerase subunit sigma-24 [Lysinibacillus sp. FJAT-14222]QQP13348.1 sigma-70 family RNA polymerase sigma factor [Lysinibacillus agricola]
MDFDEVAREYMKDLFKIAYSYVKNVQLAEDIVQDVMIKAFERQEQFRGESNYKTYLIRMTINRSYDILRSWSYRNYQLTNTFTSFFNHSKSTEELAEERSSNKELYEHVFNLSIKYREVIYLYYYLDYSVKEIGVLLDLSENTVKTRLARGREKLKKLLKEEEAIFNE